MAATTPTTFERLGPEQAAQIAELRRRGDFFWVDLTTRPDELGVLREHLGVPEKVVRVLADFDPQHALGRKLHIDEEHVVFPFYWVPGTEGQAASGRLVPIRARDYVLEAHVLVHGDFLATVHREPCEPLAELRGQPLPRGRAEEYLVYLALDAMLASIVQGLNDVELAIEDLEHDLTTGDVGRRQSHEIVLDARTRLTALRRRVGPLRSGFQRIGEEVEQVKGLERDQIAHLDRIDSHLDRLVRGIDAASASVSNLIEVGMNETIYRLTVIATVFLPLTFLASFFGMNFGWLVDRIDTLGAFLSLGVAMLALSAVVTWLWISREEVLPVSSGRRRARG